MCRMVAFASRAPRETAPYLAHLARLSREGKLVERWSRHPGGNHPDGWGAAWRAGGETALLRGALPAHADPLLSGASAVTDRFVGHARFASNRSTVSAENAHPFLHRGIALAHNGTFFGAVGAEAEGRGVSDSLVFLERLAARWDGGGLDALAAALRSLLPDRELVGEYTAANLLLLRGADLFAFRRSRKDHDYYALFRREGGGAAEAASEPLGGDGWIPFGQGELVELSREGVPGTSIALP